MPLRSEWSSLMSPMNARPMSVVPPMLVPEGMLPHGPLMPVGEMPTGSLIPPREMPGYGTMQPGSPIPPYPPPIPHQYPTNTSPIPPYPPQPNPILPAATNFGANFNTNHGPGPSALVPTAPAVYPDLPPPSFGNVSLLNHLVVMMTIVNIQGEILPIHGINSRRLSFSESIFFTYKVANIYQLCRPNCVISIMRWVSNRRSRE
jgi:hypothetical protein